MAPAEPTGVCRMTGPNLNTRREREPCRFTRKRKPKNPSDHNFADVGKPLAAPEYRSPIIGTNEQVLASMYAAFVEMGNRDFGGAWPADYVPPGAPAAKPKPAPTINPRSRRLQVAAT
jgi:hypothetical protein